MNAGWRSRMRTVFIAFGILLVTYMVASFILGYMHSLQTAAAEGRNTIGAGLCKRLSCDPVIDAGGESPSVPAYPKLCRLGLDVTPIAVLCSGPGWYVGEQITCIVHDICDS